MRIALVGYGKMGKAIEQIALAKGYEISFKIQKSNQEFIHQILPSNTDVAIEFTNPEAAFGNISTLLNNGVVVVSGSTGWTQHLEHAKALVAPNHTSFLWASNFSIGVNLFFELNQYLAQLMHGYPQYQPSLTEIHHTQKLDAPSGTAVSLANTILEAYPNLKSWALKPNATATQLPIEAIRQDPAPGTHSILYHSAIDDIEIKHTAHSRLGFAQGAVMAAEFIKGKKGVFNMRDVLFH